MNLIKNIIGKLGFVLVAPILAIALIIMNITRPGSVGKLLEGLRKEEYK